jgi:putative ABC transport system substrate-binding protein
VASELTSQQPPAIVAAAGRGPGWATWIAVGPGAGYPDPAIADILRRSASYVDKVLKGANAGDLPIQQPTKFAFVVDLKAAQALGVSISPAVLAQATEVLQ